MPILEWDSKLELAVREMNHQHQQLLDYMNKLYDLNDSGASKNELMRVLNDLGKCTVKHFSEEEAYMSSIKYPKFSSHQSIHRDLLKKFTHHQEQFVNSTEQKLSSDFFLFLRLWLQAHIMGIDRQYSDFVSGKAA